MNVCKSMTMLFFDQAWLTSMGHVYQSLFRRSWLHDPRWPFYQIQKFDFTKPRSFKEMKFVDTDRQCCIINRADGIL